MKRTTKWIAIITFIILLVPFALSTECLNVKGQNNGIKIEGAIDHIAQVGLTPPMLEESSGDGTIDARVKTIHNIISQRFQLKSKFYFFQRSGAFATADPRINGGQDGSILLGKNMILPISSRGIILEAVIAHEMAHLVQRKKGLNLNNKQKELHADIMAGWILNNFLSNNLSDREKRDVEAWNVAGAFFELGDYNFHELDHHGTKFERGVAIGFGVLQLQGLDLDTAYKMALVFTDKSNSLAKQYAEEARKYYDRSDDGKAIDLFRKASQLEPDYGDWRGYLGSSLLNQNKLKEAEVELQHAIRLSPNVSDWYIHYGFLLMRKKRNVEAEAAFRRAVKLDPNEAQWHNDLGVFLAEVKRWTEAEAAFAQAERIDPSNPKYRNNRKKALQMMRD